MAHICMSTSAILNCCCSYFHCQKVVMVGLKLQVWMWCSAVGQFVSLLHDGGTTLHHLLSIHVSLHLLLKWPTFVCSHLAQLLLFLNNSPLLSHRAMVITKWSLTSGRNWTLYWRSLGSETRKIPTVSASELCSEPRTRAFRRTCGRYHLEAMCRAAYGAE